jgi:hypothetical protein
MANEVTRKDIDDINKKPKAIVDQVNKDLDEISKNFAQLAKALGETDRAVNELKRRAR